MLILGLCFIRGHLLRTKHIHGNSTVKPFNLAALKVDDFVCKIISATFILAN